jgi:hypothetical protein
VLLVTELIDIKGVMVGDPGETGLSLEQRRRLSIGVELVANPSVVARSPSLHGGEERSSQKHPSLPSSKREEMGSLFPLSPCLCLLIHSL